MSGITVHEMTVEVTGNVVKNSTPEGNSLLRVNQEQAQDLYDSLGTTLDLFKALGANGSVTNKSGTLTVPAADAGGKAPSSPAE